MRFRLYNTIEIKINIDIMFCNEPAIPRKKAREISHAF